MLVRRLGVTALWLLALVGTGCSKDDSGFPGRDGYDAVMSTGAEPPGVNCPSGGTVVRWGLDRNRNGALDADEITGTPTYVCNGTGATGADAGAGAAPVTLMSSDTELPGTHCAAGGQALHWGADVNGDGVLQLGEITGTTYVCNGAAGANGHNTLATQSAAAEADCPHGGTAIKTGLDINDDGLLQAAEVAQVSNICNGTAGVLSLVRQTDSPVGGVCAYGGRHILSGVDTNGDGYLQDGEATQTSDVCNGVPGTPGAGHVGLFKLVATPTGVCAGGGTQIQTGRDLNDNTVLDDAEIESTSDVCNGVNGTPGATGAQGAAGYDSLAVASSEPANGGHCAFGGQRIDTGLDANRDGELQAGEVTGTSYVCNGTATVVKVTALGAGSGGCLAGGQLIETGADANNSGTLDGGEVTGAATLCNGVTGTAGRNSLVKVSAADPGTTCPAGGQRIDSGIDDSGDGVLQAGEIDGTQLVCNGASGDAGANGLKSLVLVSAEAAGANCIVGGQRIDSGLDADDSGTLEGTEITSTRYVCNGGTVVLRVTAAMWGGVCKAGGVRVDSGIDRNASGVLDDAEIQNTTYVCNAWAAAIGTGSNHTCALMSNGATSSPSSWVTCWGDNAYGQLGDGTTTPHNRPVTVIGLADPSRLAVGANHACAIVSGGAVRCWGRNNVGQLGLGASDLADHSTPAPVPGLVDVLDIAAGGTSLTRPMSVAALGVGHTCVVTSTQGVSCWGDDTDGQLGDGQTGTYSAVPVTALSATIGYPPLTGIRAISAGGGHTCAVSNANAVTCWGYGGMGQIGDGTYSTRTRGVALATLTTGVDSLSAGGAHNCVRMSADASLRCWGNNGAGQVDGSGTTYRPSPVAPSGLAGVLAIGLGERHSCAAMTNGTAQCWGRNNNGQLGDGTTTNAAAPGVSGLSGGVVTVRGGSEHSCAVTSGGLLYCWGSNASGQLGDGSNGSHLSPTQVLLPGAP